LAAVVVDLAPSSKPRLEKDGVVCAPAASVVSGGKRRGKRKKKRSPSRSPLMKPHLNRRCSWPIPKGGSGDVAPWIAADTARGEKKGGERRGEGQQESRERLFSSVPSSALRSPERSGASRRARLRRGSPQKGKGEKKKKEKGGGERRVLELSSRSG